MTDGEYSLLNEDCRRFQTLIESRVADGCPLSVTASDFVEEHRERCPECGLYAATLDAMETFERDTGDIAIRATVDAVFEARRKRHRRYRAAGGVAATFLLLLSLLFLAVSPEEAGGASFDIVVGRLAIGGQTVNSGDHFYLHRAVASPKGQDALIQITDALYIAIEEDAEFRVIEAGAGTLTLALDKGRLAAHLVPGGPIDLSIVLPGGVVGITGTIFIVEASDGDGQVEVVQGSVAVTRSKGRRHVLEAGWRLPLGAAQAVPRLLETADPLLTLLGVPDPSAVQAEAVAGMDRAAARAPVPPEPSAEQGAAETAPHTEKPTLADLLHQAREHRMAGDWSGAVSAYRRIMALYPHRPDAATAMVSAAQLLLDKMNRPDAALTYFRKYQQRRPGGGLGREALFGECTALRALGRTPQERQCLEAYLDRFPGTLYSKMAKSRLSSIVE